MSDFQGLMEKLRLRKHPSKLSELLQYVPRPVLHKARELAAEVDYSLREYAPWQIALFSALLAITLLQLWKWALAASEDIRERGFVQAACDFGKSLPIIRGIVQKQQAQAVAKIRASLEEKPDIGHEPFKELPRQGEAPDKVLKRLRHKEGKDVRFPDGKSTVSGTLYLAGDDHKRLLNSVYSEFAHTNPMHGDVFPSVRRMEAEVVNMTASLLGGGGDSEVCGAMTSGGTESILTAVKASRDYMRFTKGIRRPEMIIGRSAHAAFFKAASYFNIRLIRLDLDKDHRLSPAAVKRAITSNTVLVVASSPGFPHGIMDPVPELAKITHKRGICLHSDACLGGFVLPFVRKRGQHHVPPFDFSVPGVTSMSVDTHKFGMAHKGTSVVLYRNADIRRHQYTGVTEWSGGLYISPGFAGSRSGALIATAWAALVHMGLDGYMKLTDDIMKASKRFEEGVRHTEGLEVVGEPSMSVVAFKASKGGPDIYKVNDLMSRRGWHLSPLQFPPALHMCFTAQHVDTIDSLLEDLQECVAALKADPKCCKDGMAPMYGLAAVSPDRSLINEFLIAYQDVLLSGA
ncbi:hypothetical protein WJX73_007983 [Symbiochloris irregularis]|uniref:sphinganine-1-phosphate aldolase n=1 Tax=Symbiochloris irregularis TaxID=706552 RepID=A0AAW1PW15_9CHLO